MNSAAFSSSPRGLRADISMAVAWAWV